MVKETKKFSVVSETDGFRKTGEKDGIIYELHDQMTPVKTHYCTTVHHESARDH